MLFDEPTIRKRFRGVFSQMQQRAKPKLWKSGKRAGHVRKPGLDKLPFTSADLYTMAKAEIGEGVVRCPYCVACDRPANLIDLSNCVLDHIVPISRGGHHELYNLRCVCADCNNRKGAMTLDFFILLTRVIDQHAPPGDREYVFACLRTHGQVQQFQRFKRGKTSEAAAAPQVSLLPVDDF